MENVTAANTPPVPAASRRLVSIDALRGFDMFWILGADMVITALRNFFDTPVTRFLASQVEHKDWAGFAFYDLIFPLFIFIVGISTALSLSKTIAREGRGKALQHVAWRTAFLYFLGFIYYGGFSHLWPEIRLLGVLQRIAICYFFTGLLFCFLRPRVIAVIAATILIGYWGAMTLIPFPDVRPTPGGTAEICRETGFGDTSRLNLASTEMLRGVFIKGVNLANYVDQRFLPGYKWDGSWDPEGLASTPAAVVTCLLGLLTGLLLLDERRTDQQKTALLAAAGTAAVALGWLWGLHFPVVKKIWTSSYVLVAAGYSAWLLAFFHYVIEVRNVRSWATPFLWIGMNAITIYMLDTLLDFHKLADAVAGGNLKLFLDGLVAPGFGALVSALLALGLALSLARFLYQRRIFLKL